jgi:cold shock CspA family protein
MGETKTAPVPARREGVVASWDGARGRITSVDGGDPPVFIDVHRSQLRDRHALTPGERVWFYVGQDPIRGRAEATSVSVATDDTREA